MTRANTGLYLHIPFCRSRCSYCDFNTYVGLDPLFDAYTRALTREIETTPALVNTDGTAQTLFIGGGTPSLLSPAQIGRLVDASRARFGIPSSAEVTMECNPGTVTPAYFEALRASGVNRLSFGAQSADAAELKLLGREHTFGQVADAIGFARAAGFDNINFDLIYGLPGQQLATWRRTLDAALAIAPNHISMYALSVEQGTPMHDWVRRGEVAAPDPDAAADMFEYAERALADAGFAHYEIANWCQPGRESRHNLVYWRNGPYYGLGAGAHSSECDTDGIRRRWWKVKRPADYIGRIERGDPVTLSEEKLDPRVSRGETIMLGLRLLNEGMDLRSFEERYGQPITALYAKEIEEGVSLGLIALMPERMVLTERGHFLSNRVMQLFI